jgi:hypothetical protein
MVKKCKLTAKIALEKGEREREKQMEREERQSWYGDRREGC